MIENKLTPQEEQLLAFALFITGMRIGSPVFNTLESIAAKLQITKPFVLFAKDWLDFADTVRKADAEGKSLFQNKK